jgi:hypothetical protein
MPTGESTDTATPPPSAETAHYLASGAHNGYVKQRLDRMTRRAAEYTTLEFRSWERESFDGPRWS